MKPGSVFLVASCVLALSSCSSFSGGDVIDPTDPANAGSFSLSDDAKGRGSLGEALVFGFSQAGTGEEDSQVYELAPDVNMRAWQKWDRYGAKAGDYSRAYIDSCRAKGILFIAGGTASVLFKDEASSDQEFLDWATQDVYGNAVEHTEIVSGAYRGSLANPAYRAHLLEYLEAQADIGVDGMFLDELWQDYNGGKKWGYSGNEGYDDYFLRDFNKYLMDKYPNYTRQDWYNKFRMLSDNVIRRDIPYTDLSRNFNYRKYLKLRGYASDPRSSGNPLAAEWGSLTGNRYDPGDASFMGTYMRYYVNELLAKLRNYAREKYSRELILTSNGIEPWMDFNSLGLYNYNRDDEGGEADYVPVVAGRLNGAKSLMPVYLAIGKKSLDATGDVPLAMFIDWPTGMMSDYYALSAQEKEDFWRIYAAEAYSCGLRFAFHLRTSMPGDPTASQSGILSFLDQYSKFYRDNRDLYLGALNDAGAVVTGRADVSANLCYQTGANRYVLHLVNHAYSGSMAAKGAFPVKVEISGTATGATLRSPDRPSSAALAFSQSGSMLSIDVDALAYYDAIAIDLE